MEIGDKTEKTIYRNQGRIYKGTNTENLLSKTTNKG